jgi:hypothetical protein
MLSVELFFPALPSFTPVTEPQLVQLEHNSNRMQAIILRLIERLLQSAVIVDETLHVRCTASARIIHFALQSSLNDLLEIVHNANQNIDVVVGAAPAPIVTNNTATAELRVVLNLYGRGTKRVHSPEQTSLLNDSLLDTQSVQPPSARQRRYVRVKPACAALNIALVTRMMRCSSILHHRRRQVFVSTQWSHSIHHHVHPTDVPLSRCIHAAYCVCRLRTHEQPCHVSAQHIAAHIV